MLTFAQFQATGRDVADVRDIIRDELDGVAVPARVYAGDCYIEPCGNGNWTLTLYNESWMGPLELLESYLYAWCMTEADDGDEFGISNECAYALATACNVIGLERLADIICTPREQGEARELIDNETDPNECAIAGFAFVNGMLADDVRMVHADSIDEILAGFYEVIEQSEFATDDTRSNGGR